MDNYTPSWLQDKKVEEKVEPVAPAKNTRAILTEKIENIIENGGTDTVDGVSVSDYSFVWGVYRKSHRHTVEITLEDGVVTITNLKNDGKKPTYPEL
jgi:hypothetical protein